MGTRAEWEPEQNEDLDGMGNMMGWGPDGLGTWVESERRWNMNLKGIGAGMGQGPLKEGDRTGVSKHLSALTSSVPQTV